MCTLPSCLAVSPSPPSHTDLSNSFDRANTHHHISQIPSAPYPSPMSLPATSPLLDPSPFDVAAAAGAFRFGSSLGSLGEASPTLAGALLEEDVGCAWNGGVGDVGGDVFMMDEDVNFGGISNGGGGGVGGHHLSEGSGNVGGGDAMELDLSSGFVPTLFAPLEELKEEVRVTVSPKPFKSTQ
ncbi:hypothetical protein HDV00_007204 [Rhizophlyctis rosea]|nr:hypothetical protein HDV00_007204 [Rhizophlyctis rosea]